MIKSRMKFNTKDSEAKKHILFLLD